MHHECGGISEADEKKNKHQVDNPVSSFLALQFYSNLDWILLLWIAMLILVL